MVRSIEQPDRVRLASADWGGLCSVALTVVSLAGATLYKVHEISVHNRERLVAVDTELAGIRRSIAVLQDDVRDIARREHP
jgi:hypothetical protein